MQDLGAPIPTMSKDVVELIDKAQTLDELEQIRAKYAKEHFMGFDFVVSRRWLEIRFRNLEQRVEALEKHG